MEFSSSSGSNMMNNNNHLQGAATSSSSSRYENQKRRDWKTFGQYLNNHRPPLALSRCSGAHVLEFLRYSRARAKREQLPSTLKSIVFNSVSFYENFWFCHCSCRYLDQFGKTKVHAPICPFYGLPNPPAPCPCPLRQAWGSLDALVGRLRAAFEENGGKPEANPFGARAVRLYLREVRDLQSKARGISYEKKRKRPPSQLPLPQQTPHGAA